MTEKGHKGTAIKAFFANLKIRKAVQDGVHEELKGSAFPGVKFLTTFFLDCHEAARRKGAEKEALIDTALLCNELGAATVAEIAADLEAKGFEAGVDRLVLAAMLKAMGELRAFHEEHQKATGEIQACQQAQAPTLDAILSHVFYLQLESRWDHNRILALLYEIAQSNQLAHGDIRMAIDEQSPSAEKTTEALASLQDHLKCLPDLMAKALTDYRNAAEGELEQDYLGEVKHAYGFLQLLGIPHGDDDFLPIDPAFVSLSFQDDLAASRVRTVETVLADEKALLIVGKAGSGKSTLLKWEAIQCTEGTTDKNGRINRWHGMIPFFLRIRKFEKDKPFPQPDCWVAISTPSWARQNNDDVKSWVDGVLRSGRALVMLDGLDEMDRDLRHEVWKGLQEIVRRYPAVVYRVSSRPNPDVEMPQQNGESASLAWQKLSDISRVEVCDLSLDRIDDLIDRWHEAFIAGCRNEDEKAKWKETFKGYRSTLKAKLRQPDFRQVRDLVSTPLLCAALCVTNKYKGDIREGKKAAFYHDVCDALLQERDLRKGVSVNRLFDRLNVNDAFYIHAYIAYEMMINRLPTGGESDYLVEASKDAVVGWLKSCWGNISDAAIRGYLRPVRSDGSEADSDSAYEEFLYYLLERRSLLREPGEGRFDFHHRALQEYLTASIMPQRGELNALIDRADDDRWQDTIRLAGGGFYARGNGGKDLIEGLLTRGLARPQSRASFLLAAANLRNLNPFDARILKQVMDTLAQHVLPPRNEIEAHDIASVGDDIIPFLQCQKLKGTSDEHNKWCALTLLLIGSPTAMQVLDGQFGQNIDFVLGLLQHAQEINSLSLPVVSRFMGKAGFVPEAARKYVYDVKPLASIAGISSLDLSHCRNLMDVAFPKELKDLKRLSLDGCCRITRIETLRRMTALEVLDLSHCTNIKDLGPLTALPNLRALSLRGCEKISSLEPLAALPRLERVDLSYCPKHLTAPKPGGVLQVIEWLDRPEVEVSQPNEPPPNPTPGDVYYQSLAPNCRVPMVWIPGGEFERGEEPTHSVRLDGFWLAKYTVTQAQYEAVMGTNPSRFKGPENRDNPVEYVSWDDAVEFCKKLSEMRKGQTFTLPSEAQWEYACRAGSITQYYFGDSEEELGNYAWYNRNSEEKTHPVGQKSPNAFGLYDMHGNVWEWCQDSWHDNYDGAPTDGSAWEEKSAKTRVVRGGAWYLNPEFCRSADRYYFAPDLRDLSIGFRLLRTL